MNWIRSPYNLISCFNFLYVVFYNAALLNHLWDSQQEAGLQWWEVLHCVNKWTRHIFLLCVRLLKVGRVAVLLRPRLLTAPARAFFDHLLSGTPAKRLNGSRAVSASNCAWNESSQERERSLCIGVQLYEMATSSAKWCKRNMRTTIIHIYILHSLNFINTHQYATICQAPPRPLEAFLHSLWLPTLL